MHMSCPIFFYIITISYDLIADIINIFDIVYIICDIFTSYLSYFIIQRFGFSSNRAGRIVRRSAGIV